MRSVVYILLLVLMLFPLACKNIDDATPSDMTSFIKFFHGPYSYNGVEVEVIPDGYVILGNMIVSSDSSVAFILRTDKQGHQTEEAHYFPGNTAKGFKVLYSNNLVTGYMIVSDSIKVNPGANRVGDIEIYSAHIFNTDVNGNIMKLINFSDLSTDTSKARIDFKGISVTTTETEIIALCTYKEDLSKSEKPFLIGFDQTLTATWTQKYDLIDHNYINGKSLHYSNGDLIWATSILKPSGDFNDSYLAIPKVQENNTFKNFDQIGEGTSQLFLAKEIQPANNAGIGYGVVGTRALTSGKKSNMFFIRVDPLGNFIQSSEKYFDNVLSKSGEAVAFTDSDSEDSGESLTSTSDGGFAIAGSTQQGSDLRDIYIVKIDGADNIIWSNVFGGIGDETASCIREEENGNLIILGTNDLAGLSSVFLIKTDKNGQLKN